MSAPAAEHGDAVCCKKKKKSRFSVKFDTIRTQQFWSHSVLVLLPVLFLHSPDKAGVELLFSSKGFI